MALTISLTGPYARQGADAAEGIRLWAEEADFRLILADDRGSAPVAAQAYSAWLDEVDLLIGPYGSGLVRAVAPLVCGAGRILWNHGGSADDLAQPGVAFLPAPASSYFDGVVDEAVARHSARVVVVQGTGRFARAVAGGAVARAAQRELDATVVGASTLDAEDLAGAALLLVGRFDEDVAVIRRLGNRRTSLSLLAAVAAGIPGFEQELRDAAEGVLGPVQWWPTTTPAEAGPSGTEFANRYRRRAHRSPSYVAAQAAAAGYLAMTAHRLGLSSGDLLRWKTSTLLGEFALDSDWRQVGHKATTIRWRSGRMVPPSL